MKFKLLMLLLLSLYMTLVQAQRDSVDVNGTYRYYKLHVPDDLPGDSVPLLIGLHAYWSSPAAFEKESGFSILADRDKFIAVYPEGYQASWNGGGGCCGAAATDSIDDVAFISALIGKLKASLPVDTTKIFVSGFSNGAIMCYRLASEIGDKLAGIGVAGGLLTTDTIECSSPVPIIHFHALDDQSVLFYTGSVQGVKHKPVYELLKEWRTINGITADSVIFRDEDGIVGTLYPSPDSSANIILYTSETGGHSWQINPSLGTSNKIWEFFKTGVNSPAPKSRDTLIMDTLKRDFKVHIPSAYYTSQYADEKYPLILAFHGWDQDADQMESMTGFSKLADQKGFFVAYMHYVGPPPDLSWNYYLDENKPNDLEYCKTAIDSIMARFPIDSAKIYTVGFSDGCGMAERLMLESDGLVKATGTVGGMLQYNDFTGTRYPLSRIHFHAKGDPAVNYSNVRYNSINYWLDNYLSGEQPDTLVNKRGYLAEEWKSVGDTSTLLFYSLPWSQHAWPVYDGSGMLLSASDLMWKFFSTGEAIADIPDLPHSSSQNITETQELTLYPNPANDYFILDLPEEQISNILVQIINIQGEKIYEYNTGNSYSSNHLKISVADLEKGYYLVRIRGENFNVTRQLTIL